MPSGVTPSIPAQARTIRVARNCGNSATTVAALWRSPPRRVPARFRPGSALPRCPPPISTVPFSNCLNDSFRPSAPSTGVRNGATGSVIISIGASIRSGGASPSNPAIWLPQAPAALTRTGVWNRAPPASTDQPPARRSICATGKPLRISAPSSTALRRNAMTVRNGLAAPSARQIMAPTQRCEMAGTIRSSSSRPMISSRSKPSPATCAARSRRICNSASVSATFT